MAPLSFEWKFGLRGEFLCGVHREAFAPKCFTMVNNIRRDGGGSQTGGWVGGRVTKRHYFLSKLPMTRVTNVNLHNTFWSRKITPLSKPPEFWVPIFAKIAPLAHVQMENCVVYPGYASFGRRSRNNYPEEKIVKINTRTCHVKSVHSNMIKFFAPLYTAIVKIELQYIILPNTQAYL